MADVRMCAIVLPFLDEELGLEATCASLGFGDGRQLPSDTTLFLVDNGSTDEGPAIVRRLQGAFPGKVHLVLEPQRGYVPARSAGSRAVARWAASMQLAAEDLLVLQADADTNYLEGYVDKMRTAAANVDTAALLEALVGYPEPFVIAHNAYFSMCVQLERGMQHLLASEHDDCVVDDKVAAYRLSSYIDWAGHRREYDHDQDEIFAETTRLFIAARCRGAHRVRVDAARAEHSPRRLQAEALLHTATCGFPRGVSWRDRWNLAYGRQHELAGATDSSDSAWQAAWRARRLHVLALMGVLPLHVHRATSANSAPTTQLSRLVVERVPRIPPEVLFASPGLAVDESLRFAEGLDDAEVRSLMCAGGRADP